MYCDLNIKNISFSYICREAKDVARMEVDLERLENRTDVVPKFIKQSNFYFNRIDEGTPVIKDVSIDFHISSTSPKIVLYTCYWNAIVNNYGFRTTVEREHKN